MATASVTHFFRRRLMEVLGLLGACGVLGVALAMISYHPADPSFNHVTGAAPHNMMGRAGAYIADLLLQYTGMGWLALVVIPMVWSGLLLTRRQVPRFWLRLSMLALALLAFCGLLAVFAPPSHWPIASGLGGFLGDYVRMKLLPLLTPAGFAAVMAALALLGVLVGLGLSHRDWLAANRIMLTALHSLRQSVLWAFGASRQGVRLLRANAAAKETGASPEKKEKSPRHKTPKRKKDAKIPVPAAPGTAALGRQRSSVAAAKAVQKTLDLSFSADNFTLPSLRLLADTPGAKGRPRLSASALQQNARMLETILEEFGVQGEIVEVKPGPVVTLYELIPAPGTKSSRVIGLADDIARSMSALSARIAVIPGRNAIGIELPNQKRETVYLRELFECKSYSAQSQRLPLALGKDIGGEAIIADLAKMPHLLVAGTTGSGKSVSVNAMILSLLYRMSPDECKFIMIDPKMLELSVYDGIPHLLSPVVTEPKKAVVALKWVVREMEERYRLMSTLNVRNMDGYNKRIEEAARRNETLERRVQTGFDPDSGEPVFETIPIEKKPLPYIVVIVDEMADLMLVAGKDIEASIQRLAQMARAAGIHIIMATQRPSVDVITGVIKANFPTRISFQVTSKIDSRTILGEQGAEQLLGMGDMLYMAGGARISRIHGAFVDDKEVEAVVSHLKDQGEPQYIEDVTRDDGLETDLLGGSSEGGDGDLYQQAVAVVRQDRKVSTSYIQRKLKIGYNRAATLIERMEEEGLISSANHAGKREILMPE